jgi:[ribosomal protein S5]-alanine N-acetyltransferase
MPHSFETKHLLLRTMQTEDVEEIKRIWGSEDVMKYSGGASPKAQISRSIEAYQRLYDENGYSTYTVLLKETSCIIGVCGFNPSNEENEVELIYHFNQNYWGKGYATEAAAACIKDLKERKANIKKVKAAVDPHNPASANVLSKIGMKAKGMKWFEDTQQEELYFELE